MINIKHKHNFDLKEFEVEKSSVSMTVPDETMPLRTMLERHARGLPITGNIHQPIYLGEDSSTVDLEHMDLADRQVYLEGLREQYKETVDRIEAEKAAERKKKDDEDNLRRIEEEVSKRVEALKKDSQSLSTNIT